MNQRRYGYVGTTVAYWTGGGASTASGSGEVPSPALLTRARSSDSAPMPGHAEWVRARIRPPRRTIRKRTIHG
jgi:hypothetical protein